MKNNQPLVSVITPCYNSYKYLEDTIKSVLAQDYQNWEMLLIDDGSKDNTADIIKKYSAQDDRIKGLFLGTPSGSPTKPRNVGVENCIGDVVLYLDSDDVVAPNKISSQLPLLEDENTAIAFSNYQKMDENGTVSDKVIQCPMEVDYERHLHGCSILLSNAMYDFRKTGKVYFEYIGAEDYVYGLEVLKKGFIARNTGLSTSIIRKGMASVSSNKWRSAKWNWNIYYRHEKLGLLRSLYYFSIYATKGLVKYLR